MFTVLLIETGMGTVCGALNLEKEPRYTHFIGAAYFAGFIVLALMWFWT